MHDTRDVAFAASRAFLWDAARISLKEDFEVRYWTGKFDTNVDRLREAVGSVGNSAVAVERYIRNHW